jgi:hypothetical protein
MLEMKNADISYSQTLYHASADFRLTAMLERGQRHPVLQDSAGCGGHLSG